MILTLIGKVRFNMILTDKLKDYMCNIKIDYNFSN